MNLTSTTGEKSIKQIKAGDIIELTVKSNGRRFSKVFKIKVLEETTIERCEGCGINMEGKEFVMIKGHKYCVDCSRSKL